MHSSNERERVFSFVWAVTEVNPRRQRVVIMPIVRLALFFIKTS
jgi:hypothetical protein